MPRNLRFRNIIKINYDNYFYIIKEISKVVEIIIRYNNKPNSITILLTATFAVTNFIV